MNDNMRARIVGVTFVAGGLVLSGLVALPVSAALMSPSSVAHDNRNNTTHAKLLGCVSGDGAVEHLEVAFAVLAFACSTESVNGVTSKQVPGNFSIPAPARPEGTFL